MNPWLETAGAGLLAAAGFGLSLKLAQWPKPLWLTAWFLALTVFLIFGIERNTSGLEFVPPFSWVATGTTRYFLAAFAGPILLLTPAQSLPRIRDKVLLRVLAILFLIGFVIMPFALSAIARNELAALKTKVDPDGVCLQQTGYTCGPAAAVTGLRRLGFPADEGELAIWSGTSPYGTEPDLLADALRVHYGANGLAVRYHRFTNFSELQQPGIVLAVVKYDFLTDHFVAVLECSSNEVVVGDPLNGKTKYSEADFTNLWRFSGITLTKRPDFR